LVSLFSIWLRVDWARLRHQARSLSLPW
jgi:hypothetical protein